MVGNMSPAERVIFAHIDKVAACLPETYTWKLPDPCMVKFKKTGVSYDDNVQLRSAMHRTWRREPAKRLSLAAWYVRVWGGVKKTSDSKIASYVATLESKRVPDTFSGIASWSKIASIASPADYAIYDARVALALNAVQLRSLGRIPIKFPLLPTQNRSIKLANAHLKKLGAKVYAGSADGSYEQYGELLTRSTAGIQGAEMALFATAPALATFLLR